MDETIRNEAGSVERVGVLAKSGPWFVHRSAFREPGYSVTHRPTGLRACSGMSSKTRAIAAMRAMRKIPGDWNFTDPSALSKRQKMAGRRVRAEFKDT